MGRCWQLIILAAGFLVGLLACQGEDSGAAGDVVLAKVFKHTLHASDVEGMFADSPTPQDSILMTNAFIEKWVRETLLMQEAEKNIPKDLNIDELVRDYRSSLIKHNYEKLIIELELDSTITQEEIQRYYEDNKSQYKLEEPLLQVTYIKVPQGTENLDQVISWWNSADSLNYLRLLDFCDRYASYYILDQQNWISYSQLTPEIPANWTLPILTIGKNMNVTTGEFMHLIKVNQRLEKGAFAPMAHVQEKAEKVILHKRKIQLLEDKKEEMYELETRLKNVEIYTQ